MADLVTKNCIPCEGGVKPLTEQQSQLLLRQIPNWEIIEGKLVCNYKFKNFKTSLDFVNQVGTIAEIEGHHPNIYLHGWNKVRLTLYTHAIKGLHENDFILASKIDRIKTRHVVNKELVGVQDKTRKREI